MNTNFYQLIVALLVICMLLVWTSTSNADEKIRDKRGKVIGRVDSNGKVYDNDYGGKVIGRVDSNGKIKEGRYGGKTVGKIKNHRVYDNDYGGKRVYEIDNNKIKEQKLKKVGECEDERGSAYWLLKEEKE